MGLQKIKREWCPFVLTPDFIYVMGGEVYEIIVNNLFIEFIIEKFYICQIQEPLLQGISVTKETC